MKNSVDKRQVVEVDLEVYLQLRKLAEAAEMWDYNQDCCKDEDDYHLGLLSEAVEVLIALERPVIDALVPAGQLRRSTDWQYALPYMVQKRLSKEGYEFRHSEFEHEDCACSNEIDDADDVEE